MLLVLPVAVVVLAGLFISGLITVKADASAMAFLWVMVPALALAALCSLALRVDDIALRRGHSPDLVVVAAVRVLEACGKRLDHPAVLDLVVLDDSVIKLNSALAAFARFGVTRSDKRRRRLSGQVAGMAAELDDALDASYGEGAPLAPLVDRVVHLLAVMQRQSYYAMVSEEVGRSLEEAQEEQRIPWRYLIAHILSFTIGCGALTAVKALELGSDMATVVVLPVVVLLMLIPYALTRLSSAGMRRLPKFRTGDEGSAADTAAPE
ncbi:hypothetical protein LN042_07515 [Kitasatospora sp. RB6PN24]|uniref:hypothetical protein n=1 Tax=Kitasatospora humi TaxID=2893891 RepID=UPI001E34D408|nr:hypothetical protein [Kitasatospora humi]MCC9306955.1 hypothetical protein [Kitasatospora humi]